MSSSSVPAISVLIVNWNGITHLEECLGSLGRQTCTDHEVVLVDNGSRDGSAEYVRTAFPGVILVESPRNLGFAGGNNLGLSHARGRWIFTLNNDTVVDPNCLARLLAMAESAPQIGMVACRVLSYHDRSRIDSRGVNICRDGMSRAAERCQSTGDRPQDDGREILLPSGCAALYRRTALTETGFFDEDFFAYCEDTDLGLRLCWAGWDGVLADSAMVYHKYSQTGGQLSPLKIRLVERNHYWVAVKNFPLSWLLLVPLHSLRRHLVQAWALLAGHGLGGELRARTPLLACAWALVRAGMEALAGLPRMLARRRRLVRRRTTAEMSAVMSRHTMGFRELLDMDGGCA
ncbi:MAG: glycosyltransferase family 2 protein [Planctomycetes bacterium]|nr:glycosyltransferase family 2 protein [Planctomycetota bacterium]